MKNVSVVLVTLFSFFVYNMNAQNKDNHVVTADPNDISEFEITTLMKTGTMVPDFTLTTLEGKKIQLSECRGKVVFLNFFALSCPICMKELPELEKQIWQKYKDNENIVILTIGREETNEKLMAFRDKKHYTFPIAADTNRAVYAMFAKMYIPRNMIIDKEGKLVYTEVGYDDQKFITLQKAIENALN